MKTIKEEMIKEYKLKKLGFDFMGYKFNNVTDLSFHHLIVPKKDSERMGIGDGYLKWNGAILKQDTSHNYLHLIQRLDNEIFLKISYQMIEENFKGYIDIENLKKIRDMLIYFEKEHQCDKDKKGRVLIKREYLYDRIEL